MAKQTPPMSQTQMAAAIGVSQPQVSKFLSGAKAPDFDELYAMCREVGMDGEDLWRQARLHLAARGATPAERADLTRGARRDRQDQPAARRRETGS
jgi:transcriptional regulator with XRE-family HTH domain